MPKCLVCGKLLVNSTSDNTIILSTYYYLYINLQNHIIGDVKVDVDNGQIHSICKSNYKPVAAPNKVTSTSTSATSTSHTSSTPSSEDKKKGSSYYYRIYNFDIL